MVVPENMTWDSWCEVHFSFLTFSYFLNEILGMGIKVEIVCLRKHGMYKWMGNKGSNAKMFSSPMTHVHFTSLLSFLAMF